MATIADASCNGEEECTAFTTPQEIITRQLPSAPTILLSRHPDGINGFTEVSFLVTMEDSEQWSGLEAIDKFKIEWDSSPGFDSNQGYPLSYKIGRVNDCQNLGFGCDTSPEILANLSPDSVYVFNITQNIVSGQQYLKWHSTSQYPMVVMLCLNT